MINIGARIQSLRDANIRGVVVGYGMLKWTDDPDRGPGDSTPVTVYLVQTAIGSSCLGPACRVLREDMAVEIDNGR